MKIIRNFLEHFIARNKRVGESESSTYTLWVLVFLSMAFIFLFWLSSVKINFSNSKGVDFSGFYEVSNIDEKYSLDKVVENGNEILSMMRSDFDQSYWEQAGQNAIVEKDILNGGEFFELRLSEINKVDDKISLKYNYYYKDLLVSNESVILYFNKNDGSFVGYEDNIGVFEIDVTPSIDVKQAATVCEEFFGEDLIFNQGELEIVKFDGVYCLAWNMMFASKKEYKVFKFFVDAEKGEILDLEN